MRMSRRTAVAAAATGILTVATASMAVAANLGMFADGDVVGQLSPVSSTETSGTADIVPTDSETIYVDEQGNLLPFPPGQAAPPDPAVTVAPAVAPAADHSSDDDEYDDDEYDDDEHDEHESEDPEEHEGRDDDD